MWILAFEFSSDVRSVAVVRGGESPAILGQATVREVRRTPGLALADAALREAGVDREQIGRLAVGLGPGSYTGIRIALALVQGWQLARQTEVVGVHSTDVLMEQLWRQGRRGSVHAVVDAQRGDLYHGGYELEGAGWRETRALEIEAAAALSPDGALWISPEARPRLPFAEAVFPEAGVLGLLASRRTVAGPAHVLEPVYLRATAFLKAPPLRIIPGFTA